MRRVLWVVGMFLLSLRGPRAEDVAPPKRELVVFAAASLTDAFKEIGVLFEQAHADTKVRFSFAASNQLRTQVENGAKADVFASANTKEIELGTRSGIFAVDAATTFARNRLIVALPRKSASDIKELADLAKPGIKLVLADPAVPVGKYALEMLDRLSENEKFGVDYRARVLRNLVSREQSVKAVVAKVKLAEADAGIVYVSDLAGADSAELRAIDIPDEFNPIAKYPVVAVKSSSNAESAAAFIALLVSDIGQAVLVKHGFQRIEAGK